MAVQPRSNIRVVRIVPTTWYGRLLAVVGALAAVVAAFFFIGIFFMILLAFVALIIVVAILKPRPRTNVSGDVIEGKWQSAEPDAEDRNIKSDNKNGPPM